jgi:signal transduction histidine kinase
MMGRSSIDPRWSAIREDGSAFPGDEHPAMLTLRTGKAYMQVIMGIQKPNEMTNWISINTSPIFLSDDEKPDAVVATFHDVTEQRLADQMKTEFISTVSHELRTPLTSIKGALGLFSGGALGDISGQAKSMLDIATRNVERLGLLINDLLDMEKIASGKMELALKNISLNKLLQDALYANEPYAKEHQVCYRFSPLKEDIVIEADEHRLLQVLTNFLSNAAKFSPPHSDIGIHIARAEDRVRVAVCDSGPGIPVEYRARIFERFSQHDASDRRKHGGTGLGLAISKALIELHQGEIGFYNNDPNGTCFYFELPRLIL